MSQPSNALNSSSREGPHVTLRSASWKTFIYQKMIDKASPDAAPGDIVRVYDKHGVLFGEGLYNPRSILRLRMLTYAGQRADARFFREAIARAVRLRRQTLRLDAVASAYRLIHAEGDQLSGLVVDRYGDTLSIEVFSLGMWRLIPILLPVLHEYAQTQHHLVHVDARVQEQEGFTCQDLQSDSLPHEVRVTEHGVHFRVRFGEGHKTGHFCDQRDNRRKLSELTAGADVLDLCCYSGGFGIYAKARGRASEVTCVDLDKGAIDMARRNANQNQVRVDAVEADVFTYMRQMYANGRRYGVVVLDPPKLVFGRRDDGDGLKRYADLNRLAASMVRPEGLLLTCSCSGAVQRDAFVELVMGAVRHAGRDCQLLDVTGAGPDHPVSPRCPESSYLKAVWLRVHD